MIHENDLRILDEVFSRSELTLWHAASSLSDHFQFSAIEELLFALSPFPADTVKVVSAPNPAIDLQGGTAEDALRAFAKGQTIILRALHRRWPAAATVAGEIGAQLSVEARINAYLTPPNSHGFRKHYDSHDVLLLQGQGTKGWDIFSKIKTTPIEGTLLSSLQRGVLGFQTSDELLDLEEEAPLKHEILSENSFLYLPRGVPHRGGAGDEGALHLSIALIAPTHAEVLSLASLCHESKHPVMRNLWRSNRGKSLNPNTLAPDDQATVEAILEIARQRSYQPTPSHFLDTICAIGNLNEHSTLQRRPNLRPWIGVLGGQCIFVFGDQTLAVPNNLSLTFQFLADTPSFFVKELPIVNDIDPIEFTRDLVRLGLLEFANNL